VSPYYRDLSLPSDLDISPDDCDLLARVFPQTSDWEISEKLGLSVKHVQSLRWCFERKIARGKMYVLRGVVTYVPVDRGVTREGVSWQNIHIQHGENSTYYARPRAVKYLEGDRGVDIGCGLEKVMGTCWGIDNGDDFEGCVADDFRDASDLTGYLVDQFDWVYSANCLEHIANPDDAMSEWVRVLQPGGILFLYLPWPDKEPVHSCKALPQHTWDPTPDLMKRYFVDLGVDLVECDDEIDEYGEFIIVGRKKWVRM